MADFADIDFDEIQKAMEDTERDAFDYYLDRETGRVAILSDEIIKRAEELLAELLDEDEESYDAVDYDEEVDLPDWMEGEIDLALDILLYEKDRYVRIPERDPRACHAAMQEFAASLHDPKLRNQLLDALDGKGAFRRFKTILAPLARERKQWFGFNARSARDEISRWLSTVERKETR